MLECQVLAHSYRSVASYFNQPEEALVSEPVRLEGNLQGLPINIRLGCRLPTRANTLA
jgi:hypothetical protein